jgi:hypothetical protein
MTETAVFRAPMGWDPARPGFGVARALAVGVCGMPGRLDPPPDDLDDALARLEVTGRHREAARVRRFSGLPDGVFVWTRSEIGHSVGRINGSWYYDESPEAALADLVHVRPCTWLPGPIPEAEVPPGTLATFARGGRAFQQTHTPGTAEQTAALWLRHQP